MSTEIVVSPRISELVSQFADAVIRLGDTEDQIKNLAIEIVKQAKTDKLPKEELRELIITALTKKGCSERTIRRYMPAYLKNKRAQELAAISNSSRSKPLRSSVTAQSENTTNSQLSYLQRESTQSIREKDENEGRDLPDEVPPFTATSLEVAAMEKSKDEQIAELQRQLTERDGMIASLQSEHATDKSRIKNYQSIIRAIKELLSSYSENTSVRMNVLSEKIHDILEGNHL